VDIIDEVFVWGALGISMILVLVWIVPTFIRILTRGEVDPATGQWRSVLDWGDRNSMKDRRNLERTGKGEVKD
jgi:hypothetical protein